MSIKLTSESLRNISLKLAFVIVGVMVSGLSVVKAQRVGVQENHTENVRNKYIGKYSNSSTSPKPKIHEREEGSNRYYVKAGDSGRIDTIRAVSDTPIATPYVRFVPANGVQLKNKKKTTSKSK